jgi:hypothetical protein
MKRSHILPAVVFGLVLSTSCDADPVAPDSEGPAISASDPAVDLSRRRWRTRPSPTPAPQPTPPEPEPTPAPQTSTTYQLSVRDAFDPLYRFTQSGNEVLLQTDPTVTFWGTDYWGYWKNPFPMTGNAVVIRIGLTVTTYDFTPRSDGTIDVLKTLVVTPYQGGAPTTTVTHVGIFARID